VQRAALWLSPVVAYSIAASRPIKATDRFAGALEEEVLVVDLADAHELLAKFGLASQ
jgi:hypothetical protein